MIDFEAEKKKNTAIAHIKVMGIGGAGGNTINCMAESSLENIEFIAANTDAQALERSQAHEALQLGTKLTKGLGSGSNPDIGKRAAEEDLDKIDDYIEHADIVFLTGGLGGGTGSGALPVFAQRLREHKILSIAVVTKPFAFEGKRRMRIADQALEELKKHVDTLIVIPNQKLLEVTDEHMSLINAFNMINEVIGQFVTSISNIITQTGHINVDFADVKAIMKNMGVAVMGNGRASGANRAEEAALQAISSPLLEEHSINGARGILLNITGNKDLGLHEVSAAASLLYEQADEDANIVLGSVIDESMGDEVSVTIIATGFEPHKEYEEPLEAPQEEVQVQPTVRDTTHEQPETVSVAAEQQEKITEKTSKTTSFNANLDTIEIPTVLRRMMEEKQNKNDL